MNGGGDLAFLIPLWRRTQNIERVYGAVRATTPDARVLFVVSADDQDVLTVLGDQALLTDRNALVVDWPGGSDGDYAQKINAGYAATAEPFLFTGADDLIPHPGWYDAARALMFGTTPDGRYGPDYQRDRIGVVGTVDQCNGRTMNGTHSTHSLVARWYADCCAVADQPGAIYHTGYTHEYCDDELIQTAMSSGAYVHAFDSIVEHVHMLRDRSLDDDTYRHGRRNARKNRARFMRRRHLWGGGPRPGQTQYARPVVRKR